MGVALSLLLAPCHPERTREGSGQECKEPDSSRSTAQNDNLREYGAKNVSPTLQPARKSPAANRGAESLHDNDGVASYPIVGSRLSQRRKANPKVDKPTSSPVAAADGAGTEAAAGAKPGLLEVVPSTNENTPGMKVVAFVRMTMVKLRSPGAILTKV